MVGSVYASVWGAALKATVSVQDKDNDSLLSSSGRGRGESWNSWESYFRDRIGRK